MSESTSNPRDQLAERSKLARSLTSGAAARFKQAGKGAAFRVLGAETAPAVDDRPARTDYLTVKADLQERLLDEIGERQLRGRGQEDVESVVQDFVARVIASETVPLNDTERVRLAEELTDEAIGLGPLAPLLGDPAVTDILVVGARPVYVERFGRLEKTSIRFRDDEHVVRIIERIAAAVGRRIDAASPMADLRLPDGSRVNATLPPISIDGPTISIRRFGRRRLRRSELVSLGSLSPEMLTWLELVVRARKNTIISGGTGAGKSTLLGALAEAIPAGERIVTIEDVAELILDQEHVVRLETRPANIEGRGRITARDLVVNALRMRPDRIIVGEVRGEEALDMLQAMNTGHDGSLSTVHANSPRDGLSRIETMVLMAGTELPSRAVREQIVSAIQVLVHVRRYEDGVRRVESIAEITGIEGVTPLLQTIFEFRRRGRQDRRITGEFVATGVVPRMVEDLRDQGFQVPLEIFRRASS